MDSALVLVCAIGCTLVAGYQWAGRVGAFGEAIAVLAAKDWQGRAWSTALAVILWLVWLVLHMGSIHVPIFLITATYAAASVNVPTPAGRRDVPKADIRIEFGRMHCAAF